MLSGSDRTALVLPRRAVHLCLRYDDTGHLRSWGPDSRAAGSHTVVPAGPAAVCSTRGKAAAGGEECRSRLGCGSKSCIECIGGGADFIVVSPSESFHLEL